MNSVICREVFEGVKSIGSKRTEGLSVRIAIQYLGERENSSSLDNGALRSVLGEELTTVDPIFRFSFAHTNEFNQLDASSERIGTFKEYVR